MMRMFRRLGSMPVALLGMIALLIGALVNNEVAGYSAWLVVVPLGLLSLNLLLAMCFNPRIYRDQALLLFHAILSLMVVLMALGQLLYFQGNLELVAGQMMDSNDIRVLKRGPLHRLKLDYMEIIQGPYSVDYVPRNYRQKTFSQLQVNRGNQTPTVLVAGDDIPAVINGYRFYTTSNKGFSTLLRWESDAGDSILGSINFPSFPAREWAQRQTWVTPAGQPLLLRLKTNKRSNLERDWTLSDKNLQGVLEVSLEGSALSLAQGEGIKLTGGRLVYQSLSMWMGYKISYDPVLRWLFLAAVFAVAAMAWYLFRSQTVVFRSLKHDG